MMPQPTDIDPPQVRLAADLIPNRVDKRSALTTYILYTEYPISPDTHGRGYRRILFTDLANAVNCAAWWLYYTIGSTHNLEHLAYTGSNPAIILSALEAGYAVLFQSSLKSPTFDRKIKIARCS